MGKVMAALVALAATLAGCSTVGGFCDVQPGPIRPQPDDVETMSDSLAGQILALNEKGAVLCGWTP